MSFLGWRAATEVASWNWTGHSEGSGHCDLAGEQSITKTLPAVSVYEVISTGHTPRAKTAQNAHRHVLVLSRLLAPKKCPHKTISGGMFQSSLIPIHKSLETILGVLNTNSVASFWDFPCLQLLITSLHSCMLQAIESCMPWDWR